MTIDLRQFHDAFAAESLDALDSMESALLDLDTGRPDPELINTIFRVVHSVKGGGGTFNFDELTSFTHGLETLLDEVRAERLAVTGDICDLLLMSVDIMRGMLRKVRSQAPAIERDDENIAHSSFDTELVQPHTPVDSGSVRVSVRKLDDLLDMVSELSTTHTMLAELSRAATGPTAVGLQSIASHLERSMHQLREEVLRVRALPISTVFGRLPQMVRDLAQRLDKQVELVIAGEATEVDKKVLEKIAAPLVHLVRNSIDHGIESPLTRAQLGKSAVGTIRLSAHHNGSHIVIDLHDDGAGLDTQRILEKARILGLVGPDDLPPLDRIHALIFQPGFTTTERATAVSGRGVGMDVVLRNITELGGSINVHSEPGQGCRFGINVPLNPTTVARMDLAHERRGSNRPWTAPVAVSQLSGQPAGTTASGPIAADDELEWKEV